MRIGAVLPQNEIGSDPAILREYGQTAEGLGYRHLAAGEHVVGHDPVQHPELDTPFGFRHPWHEPFTLFAHLAAVTERIEFVTGVLVLPQRQTALVAKQAAEIDLLSGGRLVLGIGVGMNALEYEALGVDFRTRGRRVEEQIALLRAYWSQPLVRFEGRYERARGVGINPLPPRTAIPIWVGGMSDRVLERAGRLGDGWIVSYFRSREELAERLGRVHAAARAAGRDPTALAVHAAVNLTEDNVGRQVERLPWWEQSGITHLSIRTMESGISSPREHIAMLGRFAREAGLRPE